VKPLYDSSWETNEDEEDWENDSLQTGEHRLYRFSSKADFRSIDHYADFTDFEFTKPGVYKVWVTSGRCGRCSPPCYEQTLHSKFHAADWQPFVLFEDD